LFSQEAERTRIARELHDSVGQQLTLMKIRSQKLAQEELTVLSNNALEEVRALLKQLGLTESIVQLMKMMPKQTFFFYGYR
jgi:signal transduction histidine kinase